jgi:hypothetical protein
MIYWNAAGADQGHSTTFFARLAGILFFSFLSGPVLFSAPLSSFLKQTMIWNVGFLVHMYYLTKVIGVEECVGWIWTAQLGLNLYLTANNAKVRLNEGGQYYTDYFSSDNNL